MVGKDLGGAGFGGGNDDQGFGFGQTKLIYIIVF